MNKNNISWMPRNPYNATSDPVRWKIAYDILVMCKKAYEKWLEKQECSGWIVIDSDNNIYPATYSGHSELSCFNIFSVDHTGKALMDINIFKDRGYRIVPLYLHPKAEKEKA